MAANFGKGDLFCTLTYNDQHLPKNRAAATRRLQNFWRKLRANRGEADLRYLYITEGKHGEGRLHHHALINATGEDFAKVQELWPYGAVELKTIRIDRDKNHESLARYFCKEQREKVGQRLWSCSRNLKKPEVETYYVEDDASLIAPPGALVLEDSGDRVTEYGHFRFLKFLAPGWVRPKRPKAKRRRKPRVPTL